MAYLKSARVESWISQRVLIIRVEPTPYTMALIDALRKEWPSPIEVLFVHRALTQEWGVRQKDINVLPESWIASAYQLVRVFRAFKPSLAFVAGWGTTSVTMATLVARSQFIPVVADSDTRKTNTRNRWRQNFRSLIIRLYFPLLAHFAPAGKRQAAYLRACGVPCAKISPANMTVDVGLIQRCISDGSLRSRFRASHAIGLSDVVVLYVGRLIRRKGIEDLLQAWRVLRAREFTARLVIVGDGELSNVVAAAAAVDKTILHAGRMNGAALWQAYAAADMLVAPSLEEPWGLVVNEAMAAGLPVIVSEAFGCIDDLVTHKETGLIFSAGDAAELARSIAALINDPDLRLSMGSNARHRIATWTIEAQARRICEMWRLTLCEVTRLSI